MNEGEARKLIQEAMKDHPRQNFFTGKRPSGNCPSAREAMKLLGINPEERLAGVNRQLQLHMNGTIW